MLSRFQAAYTDHLVNSIAQCSASDGYIDDVNSFPAIAVLRPTLGVVYRGAGEQIRTINLLVRGYVRSSEETSINDSEILARSIEAATSTFPRTATAGIIVEAGLILTEALDLLVTEQLFAIARENRLDYVESSRVLTVATDEGLLTPYGVCDLEVEMIYVTPY
jgi:hypothetical protein